MLIHCASHATLRSQTRAPRIDLDKHFRECVDPCSVCVIEIYKLRTPGPNRWVYGEEFC